MVRVVGFDKASGNWRFLRAFRIEMLGENILRYSEYFMSEDRIEAL